MNAEDLNEIERAGRRCQICRSGRGWRRFQVVRPAGREPVVLCGSCRARFGQDPPLGRRPTHTPEPAAASRPPSPAEPRAGGQGSDRRPDRLRAALPKMPASFSTAVAARAAGLNQGTTIARLEELERRGEVHRVGNRWSTGQSPDAVALAMDRLEARTSNLRIVRERARVG